MTYVVKVAQLLKYFFIWRESSFFLNKCINIFWSFEAGNCVSNSSFKWARQTNNSAAQRYQYHTFHMLNLGLRNILTNLPRSRSLIRIFSRLRRKTNPLTSSVFILIKTCQDYFKADYVWSLFSFCLPAHSPDQWRTLTHIVTLHYWVSLIFSLLFRLYIPLCPLWTSLVSHVWLFRDVLRY